VTSVLVVNAGSTSLKLSAVREDGRTDPVASLDAAPEDVAAVGHRIVHGGASFREPVIVDDRVERSLAALTELAPLHNAPALAALDEARRVLPDVPHVAVFDTAFHATLPEEAYTYALPERFRELGVRRYGFHGLSVQWASEQVQVGRLVVCHLGGGCSVTAVKDGRSVDTTMGYTPLEGVPMATRSGSVDPGALLQLLRTGSVALDALEHALEHESGLLGLSGRSSSVEELADDSLALRVYTYRIAGAVAAMTMPLDGLDALVFTAGVGEHAVGVRSGVCAYLGFLGVALDEDANAVARPDADVASIDSTVRIVVLHAREELVVARAVRALLR
jgi:acetate kinase